MNSITVGDLTPRAQVGALMGSLNDLQRHGLTATALIDGKDSQYHKITVWKKFHHLTLGVHKRSGAVVVLEANERVVRTLSNEEVVALLRTSNHVRTLSVLWPVSEPEVQYCD